MEEFTIRLNNLKDSYYGFVVAVLNYVKGNSSRYDVVRTFMDDNPEALSSDILEFISMRKDFHSQITAVIP